MGIFVTAFWLFILLCVAIPVLSYVALLRRTEKWRELRAIRRSARRPISRRAIMVVTAIAAIGAALVSWITIELSRP